MEEPEVLTTLNALMARQRYEDMLRDAARSRRHLSAQTPVTRVTLRTAVAADAGGLRALAELDSAPPLSGPALVAEVDGRLRAALPLYGGPAIADPFHRGCELVDLLRVRAAQLNSH